MPFCFYYAGKNTICLKPCSNLVHVVAIKVFTIDSFNNLSLLRVDDLIAFSILRVAKEAIMIDLYLTVLVPEQQIQFDVL